MTTGAPDVGNPVLWQIAIGIGTIVVAILTSLITAAIRTTAQTGEANRQMSEKIDAAEIALERKITAGTDTLSNRFGDSLNAMRQKIQEVEIWGRDHYVEKQMFATAWQDLRGSMQRFEDSTNKKLDSIITLMLQRQNGQGGGGK